MALVAAVFAGLAPAMAWDAPDSVDEWHEGPVRYLMSHKEVQIFEDLETNRERVEFIRRFWERRDPDPRTPENELRLVFWDRVAEAGFRFNDSVYPGWKTDRGKMFILLGPPDDIERDLNFETGEAGGDRGLLRWHYHGGRRRIPHAVTVIAFVREIGGDWRLTDDPRLSSVTFDMNAATNSNDFPDPFLRQSTIAQMMTDVPWRDSTLDVAMDLARLQEVPTEHDLVETVIEAEDFVGTLSGAARTSTIVSRRGQHLTSITLAIRREQLAPRWDGSATGLSTRFIASAQLLQPRDGQSPRQIDIPEDAFVAEPMPAEDDPWIRFQAIRPVPAGSWQLSGAVLDRRGGGSSVIRETITVPAPPEEGPSMTGPILARAIHQSQGGANVPSTEPFRLWDQVIIPRLYDEVPSDQPFALYVEAHPPGDLPGTPVPLRWRIEHAAPGEEELERFAPEGSVEDGRGPRAWTYPAGQLPPGRFKITFTATDAKGRETVRALTFTVSPTAGVETTARSEPATGSRSQ